MFKMVKRQIFIVAFIMYATTGWATDGPIAVVFDNGITTFAVQSQGSANYVVSISAVPSGSLNLNAHAGASGSFSAVQTQNNGISRCTGGQPVCTQGTFSLRNGNSCCLMYTLSSSTLGSYSLTPRVVSIPPIYRGQATPIPITATAGQAVLNINLSNLALSVTGLTLNGKMSGQPRTITITNTGNATATEFNITYPSWPTGTTSTSTCPTTLAPQESCMITIIPGAYATSACNQGIAPTPATITIRARNVTPVTSNVVVLNYGCIYQGGYIFAMNETSDMAQSISGTVVSQSDQASRYPNGIIWSSNGTGEACPIYPNHCNASFDTIPGIDEISTMDVGSPSYSTFTNMFAYPTGNTYINPAPNPPLAFYTCEGKIDGRCNSNNIILFYNQYKTNYNTAVNPPYLATANIITNKVYYAAGSCANYEIDSSGHSPCSTDTCYNDWYLPAICQMGPNSNHSGCAATTQNIFTQLASLIGDPNAIDPSTSCVFGNHCLAGLYWSSTEYSRFPKTVAWYQNFSADEGSSFHDIKADQAGIRCVREFY